MSTTFTGTATDVIQTFTYEETQNKFKLVNNGSVDLHFGVGVFYNKVLHPMQTWENRVDYTEFDIFTLGDDCDFSVTVTDDVEDMVDIGKQFENITAEVNELGEYATLGITVEVYDTFPTDAEITAMSFYTVFQTKGFHDKFDGFGALYVAGAYCANNLHLGGKYVRPLNSTNGNIFLPHYGIREGDAYATYNTAQYNSIANKKFGTVLELPSGHFYFDAFDISEKQLKLKGAIPTGYIKDVNAGGNTWVHFPNLVDGEIGLTTNTSVVSNIIFYGNPITNNVSLDRAKVYTDPTNILTQIDVANTTALKATGSDTVHDCSFLYFHTGIYCETSNVRLTNIYGRACQLVADVGGDTNIIGISGFNILTVLNIRAALTSATMVRGDSVGEHLVIVAAKYTQSGVYLSDIDADFCLKSIVHIGNGSIANVKSLFINGVRGRANVLKAYDSTVDTEPTVASIIDLETAKEYSMISVDENVILNGLHLTMASMGGSNPNDYTTDYLTPSILFAAADGSICTSIFIKVLGEYKTLTKAWVSDRVKTLNITDTDNLELCVENAWQKIVHKQSLTTIIYTSPTLAII